MKRFKDSFYGFVIGDALGVPASSIEREELINHPVTQMLKSATYNLPLGAWSDATSLTLATMDSIIAKEQIDYRDMADRFLQWINLAKYTSTESIFGVGTTTLKAIERYKNGLGPLESGMEGINYNGSGSLMRMIPIAYFAWVKKLTESDIIDLVYNVSSITHRHEISCMGCYIFVRYMMFILDGFDKYLSYEKIKQLDYSSFDKDNINAYDRLLKTNIINYPLNEISSSGYIVDTLEAVIWCINNTENYTESVIGAINLGDNTNVIGALTGSIAATIYGYNQIDKKWISQIKKRDYLNWMCNAYMKALNNIK